MPKLGISCKDIKQELLNVHFELGTMGNNYTTENNSHQGNKKSEKVHNFIENGNSSLTLSNDP